MNDGDASPGRDESGFRPFYEETFPFVYAYFVRRLAGDRATAADLTQVTFLAALDAARAGRVERLSLPYVYGIARHKLIDHYRRRARAQRGLARLVRLATRVDPAGPVPEAVEDRVWQALGHVPASQRVALLLRYVDDRPVRDVAALLRRSVHATESLLARGRRSFRAAYGEATPDAA